MVRKFLYLVGFLEKIYIFRSMIKTMVIRDIQNRYIGTLGGFVWCIIQPLSTVLIYWFVFSEGFKIQPSKGVPFIVYFLCGFMPWSLFAESISASTTAISSNAHLVTKTIFPTEILPVVSILSSLFTHALMMLIFIIIMVFSKIPYSLYNFQVFYYLFALSVFCLGFGWFLSAINVFYRDVGQALNVLLNVWFWITPIVWLQDILPKQYHYIFYFNPMYYIVDGYQGSFIYPSSIWHNPRAVIYYWAVCVIVFIGGAFTFRKLKPEFPEVL